MLRSFFVALTGLNASKEWLDITSNNVANANTVGFKKSRPVFGDLVLQDLLSYNQYSQTVTHITLGGGVALKSTLTDFSNGPVKFTGVNTDLAIDGDGFFILQNDLGGRFFTRSGEFRLAQGKSSTGKAIVELVHSSGLKLLADKIDAQTMQPTGKLEAVNFPTELSPKATEEIYATDGSNLDPRSVVTDKDFDPTDATTYNIVYTVQIYDSKGEAHDVGVFFKKLNPRVKDSSNNYYRTYIVTDASGTRHFAFKESNNYREVTATSTSEPTGVDLRLIARNVKVGSVNADEVYWFKDGSGNLKIYAKSGSNWYEVSANTSNTTISPNQVEVAEVNDTWQIFVLYKDEKNNLWEDLLNGSTDQVKDGTTPLTENNYAYSLVFFNNEGAITQDWSGDKSVELKLPSSLSNSLKLSTLSLDGLTQYPIDFALGFQQDGYPPGLIQTISIGEDGTITGVYSNGQTLPLYRLKLAYFTSPQDLIKKGNNLFTSPSTMNPLEEYAGIRSKVREGSLELSNVDVAEELINMITAEKAYQANAKVVQTGQTILDTTINLKR